MCENMIWKHFVIKVSVVLQKNVLFSGTIFENLRWGDEDMLLMRSVSACL